MSTDKNIKKRALLETPYKNKALRAISLIVTVVLSLVIVYPVVFVIIVSFKDNQDFYTNIFGLPKVWRFENYTSAWVDASIGKYALNSIIVTLSAVGGCLVLTALGGYALSKMHIPGTTAVITILMVLNFIPGVAIYIPLYQQLIAMKLSGSLWMLILPYLAWHIPFSIYIFKNFFDAVPTDLIEAGRIDGANEFKIFLKVILPLVTPAIATVCVFNFINIWGEYMWVSIASTSSTKIITIPVGLLFFRGEYGMQWGPFSSAITIIVVPLIAVFIYLQRYFIQGLTAGAVKG